jgi:putative glycosyltransferase (TIGR04348 family)
LGGISHLRAVKILIVTPAPPSSRAGNRTTAARWARLMRREGHRVRVLQRYAGEPCDLLVALHARKSFASIHRFAVERPRAPLVVVLPGTDIYPHPSARVLRAMALATRLLVLQPMALRQVPPRWRAKTRVIVQSADGRRGAGPRGFDVTVIGHLRGVKDPFRTALAARLLPPTSRIRVRHLGAALTVGMARRARAEERRNRRYRWLGERSGARVRAELACSRLTVLSSRLEGGANVVSEAIASGTPILASRVAGNVGLLGRAYPGYFRFGDTWALARLLGRAERDARFYGRLRRAVDRLAPKFRPARERRAWSRLLAELSRAGALDSAGAARPRRSRP